MDIAPKTALEEPLPLPGSRRRRLWDLPASCHCPVIGVCLPLNLLRGLVSKTVDLHLEQDYEIHLCAVNECRQRNRLSERLQRELDSRHLRRIQQFKSAKSTAAVAALWDEAISQGDVAGAFWAALTHPCCNATLQEKICHEIHLWQHQAGARARTDLIRQDALTHENAVLVRELGKIQERTTRLLSERTLVMEALTAQLLKTRNELAGRDQIIDALKQELLVLKNSIPDLESRQRLQERVQRAIQRQAELESTIATLKKQAFPESRRIPVLQEESPEVSPTSDRVSLSPNPPPTHWNLHSKTVLCVGGRSGSIATYRQLIESVGGRFAHHDGGIENHQGKLEASLAAADLIICQTGCISHNAYWKVKDMCKRTGKHCVFVENPSISALIRTLQPVLDEQETSGNPYSPAPVNQK